MQSPNPPSSPRPWPRPTLDATMAEKAEGAPYLDSIVPEPTWSIGGYSFANRETMQGFLVEFLEWLQDGDPELLKLSSAEMPEYAFHFLEHWDDA